MLDFLLACHWPLLHLQLYSRAGSWRAEGLGPGLKLNTVFILIVAVATINFRLLGVATNQGQLSYLRVGFINFRPMLGGVVHKNCTTEDWLTKTALRLIELRSSKKLLRCSKIKPRLFSAMIWPGMSEHSPLVIITTPT